MINSRSMPSLHRSSGVPCARIVQWLPFSSPRLSRHVTDFGPGSSTTTSFEQTMSYNELFATCSGVDYSRRVLVEGGVDQCG